MKIGRKILNWLQDISEVMVTELHRIFTDSGTILIFFVAGLGYPLLFNAIYQVENILDLPMAVVDESHCEESHRFIHKMDATPEVNILYECNTMREAQELMHQRKVNGIIYFPRDYGEKLAKMEQVKIGLYCDMSSFLYYKSVFMGANFTMLDELKNIQFERYNLAGITGEQAKELVTPVGYDDVKLFVEDGGFSSFLIPALLILVIHQTLFFGIGMLAGTAREQKKEWEIIPAQLRGKHCGRIVTGRTLAYMITYGMIVAIDLWLIPSLFKLPQCGDNLTMLLFLLPFILSTIFFSITCGTYVKSRETQLMTCVFFSIILLFLSGFAWPTSNMPWIWRGFSFIFPAVHGIQGFIRINSMGAGLNEVGFEYGMLWLLTGVYFITACLRIRKNNIKNNKEQLNMQ